MLHFLKMESRCLMGIRVQCNFTVYPPNPSPQHLLLSYHSNPPLSRSLSASKISPSKVIDQLGVLRRLKTELMSQGGAQAAAHSVGKLSVRLELLDEPGGGGSIQAAPRRQCPGAFHPAAAGLDPAGDEVDGRQGE